MAKFHFQKLDSLGLITIKERFTLMDKDDFQSVLENVDLAEQEVALDLRNLEYIDSSGIGDLIKLKMESKKHNNAVYVFGIKGAVEKAFNSAKLDSVFTVLTEEEAQEKFALP